MIASVIVQLVNFLAALLFGMLGVGAAPVFIASMEGLGYSVISTIFPLAILLNGINSGFASIPFIKTRNVDWKYGSLLSVAAGIAAFTGAYYAFMVPVKVIMYLLVAVLLILSAWVILNVKREGVSIEAKRVFSAGLPGAIFAGFIGGLLAIGGGGIMMPFLLISGYNTKKAAGTTAIIATVASFAGFAGFVMHSFIPLNFLILSASLVAIASVIGAFLSIKLAKPSWLRMLLALILLVSALRIAITLI
ncbi:sulfite exporter TauE/SafE family protein [Vulcanisaeta sp. JCM 16159]|uniref:sulfite exporter TauE/SafE family protein n=1 Tax=Vulcanisaeta sp. JCM 16159 TaxID=1295371 RepID=UPI0006D0BDD9|nr:sulfite exporter TauE/SafE family protein [Vulcanisaeta sp. JCM 16159]